MRAALAVEPTRASFGAGHGEPAQWLRRARPLLGTLVEIGVPWGHEAALALGFDAIARVQREMSRFDAASDVSRLHAAPVGEPVAIGADTAEVLAFAAELFEHTEGVFDVALGSGRWRLARRADGAAQAVRLDAATRIDLGGIAKGHAIDTAVRAARAAGAPAVWVNAGGDLRTHGVTLPLTLRDERGGGVRPWATITDGAVATSCFMPGARSRLHVVRGAHECVNDADRAVVIDESTARHVSVAAPSCMWADALTKVVAATAGADALLRRYDAQAWRHA